MTLAQAPSGRPCCSSRASSPATRRASRARPRSHTPSPLTESPALRCQSPAGQPAPGGPDPARVARPGRRLDSTLSRLRALIDHDAAIILTREDADGRWSVAAQSAVSRSGEVALATIPVPANRALTTNRIVRVDEYGRGGSGVHPSFAGWSLRAIDGSWAPHRAVGDRISSSGAFSQRDAQVLQRLRRAGGLGDRQRPLVQTHSYRWSRRGADPNRPRPPRPHRSVPGLSRLRDRV